MNAALLVVLLAHAAPDPSYGAALFEPPADATPARVLTAWDALLVERGLPPDLVDHKAGVALGDWVARPHVCSGMVRYHAVLGAEQTLRVYVVAECAGQGTSLEKAAQGLAEELAKRLGAKAAPHAVPAKDAPAKLWELRVRRGNVTPPTAP